MWPQRSPSSEVMCRRSKRVRRTRALGLRTRHYRSKTTSVILACCHSRLLIVAGRSLRWRGEPAPLPAGAAARGGGVCGLRSASRFTSISGNILLLCIFCSLQSSGRRKLPPEFTAPSRVVSSNIDLNLATSWEHMNADSLHECLRV